MSEIPVSETIEFFRGIVPFNEIPQNVLSGLPGKLSIQHFPKETIIIEQDGAPCEYLYIIQTGAVAKTARKDDVDILMDYRAEGEYFGSASLISGLGPAFTVEAHEDTVCYLLPKTVFEDLIQAHVAFHEFFALRVSKLADRLKKAQTGIFSSREAADSVVFRSDGLLFNVTVGDLVKREPVVCSPHREVSEVAQLMVEKNVGAVVVVDGSNTPLGIVTKTDMTRKVVASSMASNEPVRNVMSAPVITVQPEEPSFNGLLKMAQLGCHHLCVVVGKVLQGVISQHDLIVLQGSSPLAIIKDLEKQTSIEGLAQILTTMDRMVRDLLKSGVSIQDITTFISECNDRLTRKIILLTEKNLLDEGLGPAPVDYCWLALGSEGRKEQTLRTDQDNAIIFKDCEGADREKAREYFDALAQRVVTGLERCGFPLCKGGIMASNDRWCQPEAIWRSYFADWIDKANPEDLLHSAIFFDFRPLAGALGLGQRLRSFLNERIANNRSFLRHLTTSALFNGPPLGILRTLVVEKKGSHKNQLNLKMSGLVPIVDAMRILALSVTIENTNTIGRMNEIQNRGLLHDDMVEDIKESFNFMMLLRVNHHLTQTSEGKEPTDFVDPRFLSKIQRKSLIEGFHVVRDLQGELQSRFPESLI